jgi:uncharacterized repeat protein (TIGR03803 family)
VKFASINGSNPKASLVQGSDGNFYGTTARGGSSDLGTVFKMTPTGSLTTLVNFTGANSNPQAALLESSDGNFYGTTYQGGSGGYGTVFKMTPTGTLTTLVTFTGANGSYPAAALMQGSDGNLYGTTQQGGSTSDGHLAGGGQIFRLRMGPTVLTQVQTNVTANGATLNGIVNPGGYSTPVSFQYGTDSTLTVFSTARAGTLPVGTTNIAVHASVSGLQPSITYYYRVLASNGENSLPQMGEILSFTTADLPHLALEAPTGTSVANGTGTMAFASTPIGQTTEIAVTVRNAGDSDLTSIAPSITGTHAGEFSLVSSPPGTLAAGASAAFTVRFSPTSPGAKSATLSISSNDPDENPFTLTLAGSGASQPVITELSGGRMGVDFHGIPGRSYVVQRSTNLTTWVVLSTIIAGTDGAVNYIDESPPPGSAFYRLRTL